MSVGHNIHSRVGTEILEVNLKEKASYIYEINVLKEKSYSSSNIELILEENLKECRVDIKIGLQEHIRIYGVIKNLVGEFIPKQNIAICKSYLSNYRTEYSTICEIITDEYGAYDVILKDTQNDEHYTVKVLDK